MADQNNPPKAEDQSKAVLPAITLRVEHNDAGVHSLVDAEIVGPGAKGERKVERDLLFRVARSVGYASFDMIELIENGETFCTLHRKSPSWNAPSKWEARGEIDGQPQVKEYDGSETSRAGKTNKKIDAGPDVLMIVGKTLKDFKGDDFGVSTKKGGGGTSKYKNQLQAVLDIIAGLGLELTPEQAEIFAKSQALVK